MCNAPAETSNCTIAPAKSESSFGAGGERTAYEHDSPTELLDIFCRSGSEPEATQVQLASVVLGSGGATRGALPASERRARGLVRDCPRRLGEKEPMVPVSDGHQARP